MPYRNRPNLRVLCNALVSRIATAAAGDGVRAVGVEFEHEDKSYYVDVKKEVILSAGLVFHRPRKLYDKIDSCVCSALKSPQILELSGIGNSQLLKTLKIEPVVDLPGVGENMQEHMTCALMFGK